jgi:spermidine dehydrogenase
MLAGAGTSLLSGLAPGQLLANQRELNLPPIDASQARDFDGPAGVGDYARANGNTWEVLSRAHLIRDGEYTKLSELRIQDGGDDYDVIIVGGGPASVGISYQLTKQTGGKIKGLVLENHPVFGGRARQNEFEVDGHTIFGAQASNLVIMPTEPGQVVLGEKLLFEEFTDIGMPLHFDPVEWSGKGAAMEADVSNYIYMWLGPVSDNIGFFGPGDNPTMVRNPWMNGLEGVGYDEATQKDFMRWMWGLELDRPREDLDQWLDAMSYEQLLTQVHGLSPEVSRFCDSLLATAIGLGSDSCSALVATRNATLPGANLKGDPATAFLHDPANRGLEATWKTNNVACFPGGNAFPFRYVAKYVWPDCLEGARNPRDVLDADIRFDRLDTPDTPIRMRLGATVIGVEHLPGGKKVRVVYEKGAQLYCATAKTVVMSSAAWVNRRIIQDAPADVREAMESFEYGPVVVANVALRNWRFLEKMGITAAVYRDGEFGFSCNIRQPLNVGGYAAPFDPDKPIVMTFYAPMLKPGQPVRESAQQSRWEMFATPYLDYEQRIIRQMQRLFSSGGFEVNRDVAGITINRWGHAFSVPWPGFVHGLNGKQSHADRLREGHGRVLFANGELHGMQGFVGAFGEGKRAADQVMGLIGLGTSQRHATTTSP